MSGADTAPIGRIRIPLKPSQVAQLRPHIDRVRAAAVQGNPGMLVAQIQWSLIDGTYWLTPAFLDHELAKVITEKGREVVGETRRAPL
jgi:hypothetical protein